MIHKCGYDVGDRIANTKMIGTIEMILIAWRVVQGFNTASMIDLNSTITMKQMIMITIIKDNENISNKDDPVPLCQSNHICLASVMNPSIQE